MISDFEVSQLLMSKVFHDLAGPVGAMNNGAEFLKESRSDVHQKAIELMQLSSSQAVSRLELFKAVLGYSPANSEVSLNKIKPMISAYFSEKPITFNWKNLTRPDEINMTSAASKALIISVLIVASSLIYGGSVDIEIDNAKEGKISFITKAYSPQGVKVENDAVKVLADKNLNLVFNSQNVLYLYTSRLLENTNGKLELTRNTNELSFNVTVDNVLNEPETVSASVADI
ncbi:MAG: hypothetical protein J0G32_01710 [Alphaproteobacteria bacterium]|nr:hypothetical protein [Alphaproteobacteria bacterium]